MSGKKKHDVSKDPSFVTDARDGMSPDFLELTKAMAESKDFTAEVDDDVINPPHYKREAFETIDEMMIVFGPAAVVTYCRMCAWKYRARAPYKGHFNEDRAKSNWYLQKALDILADMEDAE